MKSKVLSHQFTIQDPEGERTSLDIWGCCHNGPNEFILDVDCVGDVTETKPTTVLSSGGVGTIILQ